MSPIHPHGFPELWGDSYLILLAGRLPQLMVAGRAETLGRRQWTLLFRTTVLFGASGFSFADSLSPSSTRSYKESQVTQAHVVGYLTGEGL